MRKAFLTALVILPSVWLIAQIEKEGEPVSWNLSQQLEAPSEVEELPVLNPAVLLAEDEHLNESKSNPYRFAIAHEVSYNLTNSGQWTNLKYGDRIWRLGIRAEEAYSLSINFDHLKIPPGALLYIYTTDQTEFFGPISSKNNSPNEILGTQPIEGNEIVIEYFEPYVSRGKGTISIASIAQGYRDLLSVTDEDKDCYESFLYSEDPQLEDMSNSMVMLLVDNGTRAVTGALINNTANDGKPYVLTTSNLGSSDPSSWVFMVKMNSTNCSVNGSCWSKSLSGATVVASDELAGVSLLKINENPPGKWLTYFNGWDFESIESNTFYTVQHALGKSQSIAVTDQINGNVTWNGNDAYQMATWSFGTTFSGSAGSPLFNDENLICSTFLGGTHQCGESTHDYFSNLQLTWETFRPFLDPGNTGHKKHFGFYPGYIATAPVASNEQVLIFPNPTDGLLNLLSTGDESPVRFEMYDITGSVVCARPIVTPVLDMSDYNSGIYTIILYYPHSVHTEKVVIR